MTFLDGLGALPQLASHTRESVRNLSEAAVQKLSELAPVTSDDTFTSYSSDISRQVQLGSFAIPRGPLASIKHAFNLQVPTTLDNAMRVFRACQLPKPILLEGSPGVGKTSLITALANISGYHLCRINLSDQTDLMDLFGSDLPVEGGKPGEFAWKDAEFLRALQEGHWVLLDEMNLAPQAVLEGLNAVLDHRGTVYIPELGRSFTRHPSFRIFAAQNPLHQGGGRKGLPKSFINRFTKVYVDELTPNDLLLVCKHLFPDYPSEVLQRMISFNSALHEEVSVKRSFAKEGAPWEFNLRDVVRWASLLRQHHHVLHPVERLWPAYLSRFRTTHDADRAWVLFRRWFPDVTDTSGLASSTVVAPSHVIFGRAWTSRSDPTPVSAPVHLLQSQMRLLETAALSASHGWLVILTGHEAQGKKSLVQMLAHLTGNILHRISLNSSTDTTDILGSFEQSEEQETAQFQWVDGVLLKALQRGEWLLMDNANLCNPSVLDRLNSLCEPNGMIVLNERGHVNGEVPVVKPHPNFRLFMTVNPRYGELSRAMRNRGIEVAVVPGATDDDRRRLADHFSIPSDGTSDWSRGTLVFEAGRRGVARSTSSGITHSYAVSGRVQDDDSASNALTEFMPLVDHRSSCNALSTRGSLQYLATTLPPRWIDVFRRLVTSEGEDALLVNLVAEFARSSVASSVRDAYTQTWNISSDLTLVQVRVPYRKPPVCD
jgi:midasin (ATPase involved in ribosome maturation)